MHYCRKLIFQCILFCCILSSVTHGQVNVLLDTKYDSILRVRQELAMTMYNRLDTVSPSPLWPNIKPSQFFANIRNNILFPARINQGANTNFCGYAALTHLLLKYHPEIYLTHIVLLYRDGKTELNKKKLKPTEAVRDAAGTLKNKGELDVLHANQLWFLTLADQFKGYLNWLNRNYHPGDENKMWASTNFAKFNRILQDFTQEKYHAVGSDLIRPWKDDFYDYITEQLNKGIVLLYVNGKYLNMHKFTLFKLRAPTHFIVLYKMYRVGDNIEIQYWDYGLRTQQLITDKRLRKLIFGVSTIVAN